MMLRLVVLSVLFVASIAQEDACPPCDLSKCDSLSCISGQVMPKGPCPCCEVCALNEGESCYNATIKKLKKPKSGYVIPCGENMDCLLRQDLAPKDAPEALCTCRQQDNVCGSDGRTYDNVCVLGIASMKYGNQEENTLRVSSWGPCKAAPEITAAPEDVKGPLHHGLALDCEAKGFPIPDIHWEFKSDDGQVRNLPSDDLYVAVQVRGGPESYMVTSWVQIVDLRPTDTGVYTCVASNSEGAARADATVGVLKANKQRRMIRRH